MKKLSTILIALSTLGACMLTPLTPPPPAMDFSSGSNKEKLNDFISAVGNADLEIDGVKIKLEADGDLKLPSTVIPKEFKDMLPSDANGDIILDLHSIETVKKDGVTEQRIVYKSGDSYIAAVYIIDGDGNEKLVVKNTPTIDYGTIDWDSTENIFEAKP